MKYLRFILILTVALVSGVSVEAQVAKEVEVTKQYVPSVKPATKLEFTPNMTDTVVLHPDIDYTVTPRSFSSSLGVHTFKPATVTYWEHEKEYPFYFKVGVGYPFNSIGDFYASTHRADVGFASFYVNHQGQYSRIELTDLVHNSGKYDNKSIQMINRVGVTGGKYFGRYTLSGDLYYESDRFDRYPLNNSKVDSLRKVDFENVKFRAHFGDSFVDLGHFNFDVDAAVDFHNDKSSRFIADAKYQQLDIEAKMRLARRLGQKGRFELGLGYKGYYGLCSIKSYSDHIASLSFLYGYDSGRRYNFKVGVTCVLDMLNTEEKRHKAQFRPLPYLYFGLNVGGHGTFVPYVEFDGEVENNSYFSLLARNPYMEHLGANAALVENNMTSLPNTTTYNIRFGFSGHTRNSKFAYRFYANMSFLDNALYWYNLNQIYFAADVAREDIWSLTAALDYKPISQLHLSADVCGMIFTNHAKVLLGRPNVEANLRIRYTHRKFAISAKAKLLGPAKWSFREDTEFVGMPPIQDGVFTAPFTTDLGLGFDWFINKRCTVFIEGNNLANQRLYHWAFYREYGISCTAGVKVQF